jgi:hypothetical protein
MIEGLANRVMRAAVREMGDSISYSRGDASYSVRGLFSNGYTGVDPDTGQPVSMNQPMLTVPLADLPIVPKAGDFVTVRGLTYRVRDTQEDGEAGVHLLLHRTNAR